MKCKVYKNKEGSEVQSFDGSPQEMREFFGKSFTTTIEVDVSLPGSEAVVTDTKVKRKKSSESHEEMLAHMARLRALKASANVSPAVPGALLKLTPVQLMRNKKYWRPDEDAVLLRLVNGMGGGSGPVFKAIAPKMPNRSWKSCENRYYKLATGKVKPSWTTRSIGTTTVKKKRAGKYSQWTPEQDALLDAFVTDPRNFKPNGFVKKYKQTSLARKVKHTVQAVKARQHGRGIGKLADVRAMLAKPKHQAGVKLVAAADKHTEQKLVDELIAGVSEPRVVEFPDLHNVDVSKSSYVSTFKYFTAVKGNTITLKDAFPLFGVKSVEQWDRLLHEVISKGPSICASLSIPNSSFKVVTGEHGRVLQFG